MILLATTQQILNIFRNPEFSNIGDLTDGAKEFAIFLAPMLIMVSLAWNFFNNWVEGYPNKSFFSYQKFRHDLIRVILIFLLPLILKAMGAMFSTFRPVYSNTTVANAEDKTPFLGLSLNDKNTQTRKFTAHQGTMERGYLAAYQERWIHSEPSKTMETMAAELLFKIYTFFYYMNYYIPMLIKMIMAFMVIVSPLSAALSILPIFKGQVEELVGAYLTLAFTFLTINIIDSLVFGVAYGGNQNNSLFNTVYAMLETDSTTPPLVMKYIIYNILWLSILGVYLLSFWLTSSYVGNLGIGILLSIVTTLANML